MLFVHSTPICALKVLWDFVGRFGNVLFFCISIPTYDIASPCRCVELVDDGIDGVLATFVSVRSCSFLYVKSASSLSLLCSPFFRGTIGVCSADHSIYADRILDLFLHAANDFGSHTCY